MEVTTYREPRGREDHGRVENRVCDACLAMTAQYAGLWTIARTIVHEGRAPVIACTGSATLTLYDSTIVYDEAVSFYLANKEVHATRAYRFTSSDGSIVATFADRAPFFALRLQPNGIGTAVHQCGDDRYELTLTLQERAVWFTQWNVRGSKRLSIMTKYTRSPTI